MRAVGRRHWMACVSALAAAPVIAALGRDAAAQGPEPQVVKLVAQRFHYTPREFQVKAGQPVLLEFTALDFVHGFSLPDLKLRADLPPGIVTRVRLTVDTPGDYDFLCDNFCGEGHAQMAGRMVVVSA
jgi:cytochrome c oxidase subunit 2